MLRRLRCSLLVLAACGPSSAGSEDGTGAEETTAPAGASATTDEAPTSTRGTTSASVTTGDTGGSGEPSACVEPTGADEGSDDTTGPGEPIVCNPVAGRACTTRVECLEGPCGNQISAIDALGCPRAMCDDDTDCPMDEVCLLDSGVGSLLDEVVCTGTQEACTCAPTDSPTTGVCISAQLTFEVLPGFCGTLTTAEACERFDIQADAYCRWSPIEIFCEGSCEVAGTTTACLGFIHLNGCGGACGIDGSFANAYWRARPGGSELYIEPECGPLPSGWDECSTLDPHACACACEPF